MKIETRTAGPVTILTPDGPITIGEKAEEFRAALEKAIASGAAHIIVDGSRVRYMDSTGIGEMIAASRALAASGGRVGISSPSPKLREIFEITRLSMIFVIGETEEDVAAGF